MKPRPPWLRWSIGIGLALILMFLFALPVLLWSHP